VRDKEREQVREVIERLVDLISGLTQVIVDLSAVATKALEKERARLVKKGDE
jgi:hypothetical protein